MGALAIVQARMGSTRLPGKILLDLAGQTMLGRVVERCRRATLLDGLIVATSLASQDEAVVSECRRLGVEVFRGSESDVLERYVEAARQSRIGGAPPRRLVRITSDCPLIAPEIIDRVLHAFEHEASAASPPDYASNTLERTYPQGLDVEVFTAEGLERAAQEAREPYERTHVTPYFYRHPELFRLLSVTHPGRDHSAHRWTVDTPEDLDFARALYARLPAGFGWRQALDLLDQEPDLARLNAHVRQKSLEEC